MVMSCCIIEFCNGSSVMYSKERDESAKLLVDVCGVGQDKFPDVVSTVGNVLVVN